MSLPNAANLYAGFKHGIYLGSTRRVWLGLELDDLVGLELEKPDPMWLNSLPMCDLFEQAYAASLGCPMEAYVWAIEDAKHD